MVRVELPRDYDWWEIPREPLPNSGPELMALQFEQTGNALYAWRAFAECCEQCLPLPASVLAYLQRVAADLLALAERPPERVGPEVAQVVLGVRRQTDGRGSWFSDYRREERDVAIADAVDDARFLRPQYPPRTVGEIVEEVANQFNVTERVVNEARRRVPGLAVEPVRPVKLGR